MNANEMKLTEALGVLKTTLPGLKTIVEQHGIRCWEGPNGTIRFDRQQVEGVASELQNRGGPQVNLTEVSLADEK